MSISPFGSGLGEGPREKLPLNLNQTPSFVPTRYLTRFGKEGKPWGRTVEQLYARPLIEEGEQAKEVEALSEEISQILFRKSVLSSCCIVGGF